MASEQRHTPVSIVTTIKPEPVETDPLALPKQEFEDIIVKEETPVETDPLALPKQEFADIIVKEETPVETDPLALPKQEFEDIIVKEETPFLHEWEVPADLTSAEDLLSIKEEECLLPKDYLGPRTFHIEKTENEEDEEEEAAMSYDELKELKYEVGSTSSYSEPESTFPVGSGSLDTKVHLTAGKANRRQCTTKQEAFCGNQRVTRPLMHQSATCKKTSTQLQDMKDSCELLQSCRVCHKTFTGRRNLKRYLHLHSCERPYKCGVCNKTFKRISDLKRHSLLQTGDRLCSERPYICNVCNKTFKYRSELKRHRFCTLVNAHISVMYATKHLTETLH